MRFQSKEVLKVAVLMAFALTGAQRAHAVSAVAIDGVDGAELADIQSITVIDGEGACTEVACVTDQSWNPVTCACEAASIVENPAVSLYSAGYTRRVPSSVDAAVKSVRGSAL